MRNARHDSALWAALALVVSAFAIGACKVELRPGAIRCGDASSCPDGWSCHADDNLCYPEQSSSSASDPDGGERPAADGGGGSGGRPSAAPVDAASGEGPGKDGGAPGADAGTMTPPPEQEAGPGEPGPSGTDGGLIEPPDAGPDADAAVGCRSPRACYDGPSGTRGRGACRDGVRACRGGEYGPCVGSIGPQVDTCNGVDDDCDGNTDERIELDCYNSSAGGCVYLNATFTCQGVCRVGKQVCDSGQLSQCNEAIVPAAESCTSNPAADEDCDGATDEICECSANTPPRTCYTGPTGTAGVGVCHEGSQTCVDGMWGACVGAVAPQPETCANQASDDDCNGTLDNVPTLGDPCMGTLPGACSTGRLGCVGSALACVTPAAATEICNAADDDCDGTTDEGFNLNTDPSHCGSCDIACGKEASCCAGECRAPLECPNALAPRCATTCPICPPGRACE